MKDIRIDGRWQRVFVLRETDDRVVYIPIKSLHRVDYDRLVKAEKDRPKSGDLMEYLRKIKFDNGRNALAQLDNLVQVCNKSDEKVASRLQKSDEKMRAVDAATSVKDADQTPNSQVLNENTSSGTQKSVTSLENPDDPNKPVDGVEYLYTHHSNGQKRIWGGKGPMPKVIQDHIDNGGKLSDFATKG